LPTSNPRPSSFTLIFAAHQKWIGCVIAVTETRRELRHDIYQEAEQFIARRALLLPLFHEQTYRFARPEIQDFEVSFSLQTVPYEKLSLRK
jgi:ABC-type oligopeptide transport system substrate-binding subunit